MSCTRSSMRSSARREHRQVGVQVVAQALVGGHLEMPSTAPSGRLELVHHRADEPLLLHGQAPHLGDVADRVRMRPSASPSSARKVTMLGHVGLLADARAGGWCGPWPARPAARQSGARAPPPSSSCAGRRARRPRRAPSSAIMAWLASTTSPSRLTTSTASRSETTREWVWVFSSARASRLASCSGAQPLRLGARLLVPHQRLDHAHQVVGHERLGQEEVHALARGRDGRVDVGVGGDHAGHGVAAALLHGLQQAEAVGVGQPVVEQGDVVVALVRGRQRLGAVAGLLDLVALHLEDLCGCRERTPYSSSTMRMLPSAMVVSSPGLASDRRGLGGRAPAPGELLDTASSCLPVTGLSRNRSSRDHSRSPPASPSKRLPVSRGDAAEHDERDVAQPLVLADLVAQAEAARPRAPSSGRGR